MNWQGMAEAAHQRKLKNSTINSRKSIKYSIWRYNVLKRDRNKCILCHSNYRLNAHHVLRWIDEPTKRGKVQNGVTLCKNCHDRYHQNQGKDFYPEINEKLLEYLRKVSPGDKAKKELNKIKILRIKKEFKPAHILRKNQ